MRPRRLHYATKSALAHRAGHVAKVTLRIHARGGTAMGTHVAGAVLRTALGPERATAVAREGRPVTG